MATVPAVPASVDEQTTTTSISFSHSLPPPASPASPLTDSPPTGRRGILQYFSTPRNTFGLFRKYYGAALPSHDPEEYTTPQDLRDANANIGPTSHHTSGIEQPFYPYPNQNSFALGEWYWTQEVQKSQSSFRRLIEIVGDPHFLPDDVRSTNWTKVNTTLAANKDDRHPKDDRRLDEDFGWKHSPISIQVPFHSCMTNPGPQRYLVGDFFHRSIISVI